MIQSFILVEEYNFYKNLILILWVGYGVIRDRENFINAIIFLITLVNNFILEIFARKLNKFDGGGNQLNHWNFINICAENKEKNIIFIIRC